MTEERITRTTDETGNTHTTHTVVTDSEGGTRKGGFGWGLLILLAVIAIGAFILYSQVSDAEIARDNAVADAADEVGEAAGQVGDAAQNAGEAVEDAVDGE